MQDEELLIHVLYRSTWHLYCLLISRFTIPEDFSKTDDVLSIDLKVHDVLKDFISIFIRVMIKQYARDNDIVEPQINALLIKFEKYFKSSMLVLKNEAIKSLTFLRPPEIQHATLDKLHVLMQRFLRVIIDMNALESEFLEYQATLEDEFPTYSEEDDKPIHNDHIWYQISMEIDLYSGQPHYKHLTEFAEVLLLVSHSNSYCEIIFSTIRKICTDGCHERRYNKVMHLLVYTQKHHLKKNSHLGILTPKVNIFGKKKLACHEWEKAKLILAQAKSATCKNLEAMKQQQQEAAAKKNPEG